MSKNNTLDELMDLYSSAGLQPRWGMGFSASWVKFGSKRYTGKKGIQNITHDLQDMYVVLEKTSEKIELLKNTEKNLVQSKPTMWDVKVDTIRKQLDAESINFGQLELRYRFLTLLRSMYSVISTQELLNNVDKFLNNRKNTDSIKESLRDMMMNEKEMKSSMESMSDYMDAVRGTRPSQQMKENSRVVNPPEESNDDVEVL